MRNTVIGLALAAALLGGLFFAATHRARHQPAGRPIDVKAIQAAAAAIEPGFVGRKRVGPWEVVCAAKPLEIAAHDARPGEGRARSAGAPLPLSMGSDDAAKADSDKPDADAAKPAAAKAGAKLSLGRCRTMLAFRSKNNPKAVVMTVSFRIVGAAPGKLGLFVRTPLGKKGQEVVLRLGKGGFKLPVAGCGKAGCMAVGVLAAGSEKDFTRQPRGELLLPPAANGKRGAVVIPFLGLPASLAAIRRAQG